MGVAYSTVRIKRFQSDEEPLELRVKIDSGATMLVIPGWVQEKFGFPLITYIPQLATLKFLFLGNSI